MDIIADIMTPDPLKVPATASVFDCLSLMDVRGRRHIPVVDSDGAVTGVVSEHAAHLTELSALVQTATVPVPTCDEDTSVAEALTLLGRTTLDCIVIVDDARHPIGILTEHDVVRLAPALLQNDPLALRRPDRMLESTAPWSPRSEAFEQMVDGHFRHLPVVDGASVVGVVSLRDLLASKVTRGEDGPVEAIMTAPAHVAIEGIPFSEAAARMAEEKIGCIPILDFAHRPVGILTRSDILERVLAGMG